jgi:hypothetical protein
MFGHADLERDFDLELGVVMASAAEAARARGLIEPQLQTLALVAQARGLGRLVNRVKAADEGDTLFLRLAVPEAEVRQLVGTPVDSGRGGDQNAHPQEQPGVEGYGQGDAAPGG